MASKITHHFKKGLLSGVLAVLPLFITAMILKFLFGIITGLLSPALEKIFPEMPYGKWIKPVVAVAILLIILYLLGLATKFFLGRWFLNRIEELLLRIPLLSSVYGSSREIVRIFLNPDRADSFKELVLVEFPGPGLHAFGFITRSITDWNGRPCYTVFIPTTPNPTTGFLEVVEQSRVVHCGISVEEGVKMIMSGGLLGPERLVQASPAATLTADAAENKDAE